MFKILKTKFGSAFQSLKIFLWNVRTKFLCSKFRKLIFFYLFDRFASLVDYRSSSPNHRNWIFTYRDYISYSKPGKNSQALPHIWTHCLFYRRYASCFMLYKYSFYEQFLRFIIFLAHCMDKSKCFPNYLLILLKER